MYSGLFCPGLLGRCYRVLCMYEDFSVLEALLCHSNNYVVKVMLIFFAFFDCVVLCL